MKTSNYILLTLFLFLIGSFLLIGMNVSITKIRFDSNDEANLMTSAVPSADFSVVVAEKDLKATIYVNTSDEACLISFEDKWLKTVHKPLYEVRQDTLFIKKIPNNFNSLNNSISIQCHEIKSFVGKPNSDIILVNPDVKGKLMIVLDNAKLKYQYNGKELLEPKTKIENGNVVSDYPLTAIKIIGRQSEIEFSSSKSVVDLDLDLNETYFYLQSNREIPIMFNKISGSIKNDSRVDFCMYDSKILNIDLKGDKTSSFYRSDFSN